MVPPAATAFGGLSVSASTLATVNVTPMTVSRRDGPAHPASRQRTTFSWPVGVPVGTTAMICASAQVTLAAGMVVAPT